MSETKGDWIDDENDVVVAAYFSMLVTELAGISYVKADCRREVEARLGRSKRSVEFKNMNISAVLMGLGQPWIEGYKPATKFQLSLVDTVLRWIERHPHWLAGGQPPAERPVDGVQERPRLWIGPSPLARNEPPLIDPDRMAFIARRFDVAARDARNHALGRAGEELVFEHEKVALQEAGCAELASKVRWVARDDGDGVGYDIASFEVDGASRLIEVKTTNGWERTPFHITRNELACADTNRSHWVLLRLWNFAREPRAFELRPPLQDHVELTPTTFMASPT